MTYLEGNAKSCLPDDRKVKLVLLKQNIIDKMLNMNYNNI